MTLGLQTLQSATQTDAAALLRGEIRHPHLRYGLHLQRRGSSLHGRLGGRVFFERLQLEEQSGAVHGLVTGNATRLAIYASQNQDRLECRFTGPGWSAAATLHLGEASASGSLVTPSGESQINLQFNPRHLTGTVSDGVSSDASNTERLWLESAGEGESRAALIAALLAGVIVTRVVHRANLEFLPGVGGLM